MVESRLEYEHYEMRYNRISRWQDASNAVKIESIYQYTVIISVINKENPARNQSPAVENRSPFTRNFYIL